MDGKTTTDWSEGSCTHTNYATDAWWRVDLGTSLPVAEVVVVNRDCGSCGAYLSAFEIRIGKTCSSSSLCSCSRVVVTALESKVETAPK